MALNLSLLSRGVGEVQRNGHEKVEVKLEPEDYFNWVDDPTRLYLPPILPSTKVAFSETPRSFRGSPKNHATEAHLPKTFTTRRGALLLFSEDMAQKRQKIKAYTGTQKMSTSLDDLDLNTVEDFAKKILSYGSHSSDDSDRVYLKFVHDRHRDRYRFIRPGYSPKRYLASWSRSIDEAFLSKLTAKGYLNENSLHQANVCLPHIRSHINEDLSRYPAPYRILRHMLMSPGSLSGYTFFWARPRSVDSAMSGLYEDDEDKKNNAATEGADSKRNVQDGSIKVLQQDDDGNFKEVHYGELDKQTQQNVLTELLVKSAISHALMKQQEVMEELSKSTESIASASHYGIDSGISAPHVPEFDMVEAVASLLNTAKADAPVQKERRTTKPKKLDVALIPETGHDSRNSRYGGSFKGAALRGSVPSDKRSVVSDKSKDSYQSWAIDKDQMSPEITRSTHSLPPIASTHGLSPIIDVDVHVMPMKESGVPVLPPIEGMSNLDAPPIQIEPPTPQATTLTGAQLARGDGVRTPMAESHEDDNQSWAGTEVSSEAPWGQTSDDEDKRKRLTGSRKGSAHSLGASDKSGGLSLVGHAVHSSGESHSQSSSIKSFHLNLEDGLRTGRSSQKGQQSQRSKSKSPSTSPARTEASSKHGSDTSRSKGSLIMGPGGDVISIGGAAQMVDRPEPRDGDSVCSEETESVAWRSASQNLPEHIKESETRYGRRGSASQKSLEEEVLGQLADHASKIAAGVLASDAAGLDLAKDAKDAAVLWTDQYGHASDISPSQSVRDVSERQALQDLVNARKGSQSEPSMNEYKDLLKTTLTNIVSNTSGSAITIPPDAEVDDDLVKALLNEDLAPDDIEVFTDPATGKSIIRSKSQMLKAMGDVEEGHTYQKGGGKKAPSIPRQSLVGDVGEPEVINYNQLPGEEDDGLENATGAMSVTIRSKKSAGPDDGVDAAEAWKDGQEIKRESSVTSQGRQRSETSDRSSEGKGQSVKSLKSKTSADKKDDKPEFVVGKVKEEKTLPSLYGPYDQPTKREESSVAEPASKVSTDKTKKKGKVAKPKVAKPKVAKPKKETKKKVVKKKKPATPPPKEPTPPLPKQPTPTPLTPTRHSATPSWRTPSPESDGSSIIIVPHEFSDDETTDRKSGATSLLKTETEDFSDSTDNNNGETTLESDASSSKQTKDESALLRQMNNKALRAAKRNAQAEKRRHDVERKRREREEQMRRGKEEHERQEQLRQELEEERRRKEEERRLIREQRALERQNEEAALIAEEKRRMRELEREKKLMEEHQRRLEELKRKQMEEEMIRKELQREREREEAMRRRMEEQMLAQMEEAEREQYLLRKKEEEERRIKEAELERQRQEAEARRQMEEARRLAEELERKKKEFERRLKFTRGLMVEAKGMDHTQDINRAFVWSYYELLQWLGLDLPKEPFLGP